MPVIFIILEPTLYSSLFACYYMIFETYSTKMVNRQMFSSLKLHMWPKNQSNH